MYIHVPCIVGALDETQADALTGAPYETTDGSHLALAAEIQEFTENNTWIVRPA